MAKATDKPAKDDIEIVNKLSAKKVLGKLKKPEKATPLYVVLGIADGIKSGTSTYGEWEGLTGQFELRVTLTGHDNEGSVYYGTQLFLPKTAHEMVSARFKGDANGEVTGIQFALEVGYKPAETSVGYEFTVKPVGKMAGADPLAALRGEVLAALPMLK